MTAKKSAAKAKSKRKVATQPATAAGAGVTLTSIVPFLPPNWQSYGYIAAAALGVIAPVLAARQQQRSGD
jgi:hypothetical protein